MSGVPDYALEETINYQFNTRTTAGAPVTFAGSPAFEIYEDSGLTQITAAETLIVDHDGVTGAHDLSIVATAANGFENGKTYSCRVSAGTVGGQSVVGETVWSFSIGRNSAVRPTVAGRTLDVTATGAAGIDWGNVENPTTALDLSGTDIQLVDTVTTLTNKTGFSLAATGLDAIVSTATGMVEIAKAIWDRALTGATHNLSTSAGRRLRQIQESGAVYNGQVWVDTNNGTAGTTPYENGTSDNHVDLWASARTIAPLVNGGLRDYHIINGSTILLAENSDNISIFGDNYILQLGGESCVDIHVEGATVSGTGLAATGEMHFEGGTMLTASIQGGHWDFSRFKETVTFSLAGDYQIHNCYSGVAGPGGPTFAFAAVAISAEWRNWSGSINFTGLTSDDTITLGGRLGTVDLGSPASAVAIEIRGTYKEITNVGSAAINLGGAIMGSDVADTKTTIGTAGAGLTDLGGMSTGMKAEVQVESTASLVAIDLDHLLKTATAIPTVTAGTFFDQMLDDGTATFDRTTDSLQAIRDRGDSAWITATGFSTHSAAAVWSVGTRILTASTNFNDLSASDVNTQMDVALNTAIPGSPTAASVNAVLQNQDMAARTIVKATVDTVTNSHTPTATEFQADDVTEATTDHFKGRVVIFTSGNLKDQATDILGYTRVGGIGQFTVTAMTEAPANDDTFVIV